MYILGVLRRAIQSNCFIDDQFIAIIRLNDSILYTSYTHAVTARLQRYLCDRSSTSCGPQKEKSQDCRPSLVLAGLALSSFRGWIFPSQNLTVLFLTPVISFFFFLFFSPLVFWFYFFIDFPLDVLIKHWRSGKEVEKVEKREKKKETASDIIAATLLLSDEHHFMCIVNWTLIPFLMAFALSQIFQSSRLILTSGHRYWPVRVCE